MAGQAALAPENAGRFPGYPDLSQVGSGPNRVEWIGPGFGAFQSGARVVEPVSAGLLFPNFIERLAIDAECRGGAGFQPPKADIDPTGLAIAVFSGIEARE